MAVLVIIQGPPCAGKSTWARGQVEQKPARRVIVSRDDIRHSLGDYWVTERESLVAALEDFAINEALRRDFTVYVDGTNLDPARVQHLQALADKLDLPYETEQLYVSFPEAVKRDANEDRAHHIGEDAIRQFYRKYFPDRYADEVASDPGPYLVPSRSQEVETRLITDASGNVTWTPTREDLENIYKLAGLRFSIHEIALALEVPEDEARRLLTVEGTQAFARYHAGKLQVETNYRNRIRRAAEAGDLDAIKLLEEWAVEQRKYENGF
ncbi:MAG: AAA family ATPase [Bacteroidales bacterium]|nr:AAA family ATPase [Bacteroidales bacterium]